MSEIDLPHSKKSSWWKNEWLLLGLIVLLGASLRIARGRNAPLVFDEVWHLELSTGRDSQHWLPALLHNDEFIPFAPAVTSLRDAPPWYSVWTHMTGAVHPPLYCVFLRIWRDIFGEADQAARMLSIVFSLVTIVTVYYAGKMLNGASTGLWGALIFAIAPTQVFINQEVRGYALLQMISMLSIVALIKLEKSPHQAISWVVALGLGVLGMMLTHYFAISGALAIGIYVLLRLGGRKRTLAITALISAAVIYSIVWVPFLLGQRETAAEPSPWLHEVPGLGHILRTLARAASWPMRLVTDLNQYNPLVYLGGLLFVLPPLMLRRRPGLLMWYLWTLCTLGFIVALDLSRGTRHLIFPRYVSLTAPGVFLLFAAIMSQFRGWFGRVLLGCVVFVGLAHTKSTYDLEQFDWRLVSKVLDDHAGPAEPIVYYQGSGEIFVGAVYYLVTAHYSHGFPHPIVKLTKPAPESLMRKIPGKTAWLITFGNDTDIAAVLPGATTLERFDFPTAVFRPTCVHVRLPVDPSAP